jgi:hypothetical protein
VHLHVVIALHSAEEIPQSNIHIFQRRARLIFHGPWLIASLSFLPQIFHGRHFDIIYNRKLRATYMGIALYSYQIS